MSITHGNILAVFFSASQAEIQEGRAWYSQANLACRVIADTYQVEGGYQRVAGVIAALSPNNRWSRNVRDAESLIKTYTIGGEIDAVKVSTFSKNKEKAIKILNGEGILDVLGGLKVRAFYSCIIGGEDVCVDGHAFAIWSGQRIATSKTPKISENLYRQIADDYNQAARVINYVTGDCYTPSQIQAITWVTWRNLFNGEAK
jgi:hypothetical protein